MTAARRARPFLAAIVILAACTNPLRDRLEELVSDYQRVVSEGAVYVHGTDGDDANPGTRERPRRSIQSAVDLLADLGIGGDVRVAEGTYLITTPLRIPDGVAVRGGYDADDWEVRDLEDPPQTLLQGSGVAHVLGFAVGAGPSTLLEGFTVRAAGPAPGEDTVAVYCDRCAPTVRFNHIDASEATGTGVSIGVFSLSASPVIEANTIDAGQGAGDCWGVANSASAARVRNNVIYCSSTGGCYCAVRNGVSSAAVLQNNTVHLRGSGDTGVYNLSGCIVVENNILYASAAGACGIYEADAAARPERVNNNDIHGCSVVYRHAGGDCASIADMVSYLGGEGVSASDNTDADPLFVNASIRDYHLSGANGGGLDLSASFTGDRDGEPRTPPWSMGAYECDG